MNAKEILNEINSKSSVLDIIEEDSTTLRIYAPFSFGIDGEIISFCISYFKNRIYLWDDGNAFIHFFNEGLSLTEDRYLIIQKLAKYHNIFIGDDGNIYTYADLFPSLQKAIFAMINVMNAVGHF